MPTPTVSFILTTYNFGDYIQGAVESLLRQKGGYSLEVIIIDDCSTDHTPDVISSLKDERIRFVRHNKNRGVAPSINEGYFLAKGEYICRFDGDDEWYPWLLEETIPFLEKNPEVGFVYGDISMINSTGEITVEKNNTEDVSGLERKQLLQRMLQDYFLPAPSIVGRRSAWEDAFPLDDDLIFCDFDLAISMMSKWKIGYIPKVLSKYRVHEGNIHTTSFLKQRRGEKSILKTIHSLLDHTDLFSNFEKSEILRAKYLQFADSYFGLGSMQDARRCYKKALTFEDVWKNNAPVRRYVATYVGQGIYNEFKSFYKKIAATS